MNQEIVAARAASAVSLVALSSHAPGGMLTCVNRAVRTAANWRATHGLEGEGVPFLEREEPQYVVTFRHPPR